MKKPSILLLIAFLFVCTKSNAQLETIDKIAGYVVPLVEKIFSGDTSNKEKKDAKNELATQTKGVLELMQKDAENLEKLNKIFTISSTLSDDIGAMESLTNSGLISNIIETNSHSLHKNVAITFDKRWNQLNDKKKALIEATKGSKENSIGAKILGFANKIDEHLININSQLSYVPKPSLTMNVENAKLYVDNLKEVYSDILTIKLKVEDINESLKSTLDAINTSFKKANTKASTVTSKE